MKVKTGLFLPPGKGCQGVKKKVTRMTKGANSGWVAGSATFWNFLQSSELYLYRPLITVPGQQNQTVQRPIGKWVTGSDLQVCWSLKVGWSRQCQSLAKRGFYRGEKVPNIVTWTLSVGLKTFRTVF